ncbi:uncharacterized protein B0T23DRAFT_35467 [Neurospora hispaniola]|uniref:CipC-like antibiotic response protein n=1 Tax=Neurospora hispaniola TaxID=588809 RepID=A0AAJ0IGV1_9PEZI|nr:hypothetical protein B0T23DRAFT_35467 [Neurospora hispaniola]
MGFFGFDEAKSAHREFYSERDEEPKLSHELLGGAVAFEAMHMWEKEQRREGKPVNHGVAKEALAALAGAEVDKMIERRGLEGKVDREEAKRHAREKAHDLYDRQYGERDMYDP